MYDSTCGRCALAQSTSRVCIPGTGNPHASIILFGEAPGATEEAGGEPFIGPAGRLLDEALLQAGLTRSDIFISNAVRCRPPENRTPSVAEIKACRYYTAQELSAINPKVVVSLGGTPLKALTGLTAVGKARGSEHKLHPDYRSDIPLIATWHPAAALHQPHERIRILAELIADLKMAKRVVGGQDGDADATNKAGIVELKPSAASFKRLAHCAELAVDLEWESLDDGTTHGASWPWSKRDGRSPRLVSIGFAGREQSGTVISLSTPWHGAKEELKKAAAVIINNVPSIYHYGTADVPWLLWNGMRPKIAGDTHILATLLNLNTDFKLGTLAATLLPDLPSWKSEGDEVKGRYPSTMQEWARLLAYNAKDCVATLLLHERMMDMLKEQGRERVIPLYKYVLAPAVKAFSKMAVNGVRLNKKMLDTGEEMLRDRILRLELEVAEMVGMPGRREVTSGDALAPLVEQLLHIRLPRTPRTNKPSLTQDGLLQLKGKHPIVDLLFELSQLRKRHGTYFKPWAWLLSQQETDLLHTVYKLTTARTGRSSAQTDSGGTMQQFPRGGDMRRMVIAREGYTLVLADESQVELRIGAWISQEPTMQRFLREGRDLHEMTAGWYKAVAQGVPIEDFMADYTPWTSTVTKDERSGAKIPNFAYLYGGQEGVAIDTARRDYGIELDQPTAKRMRDGYFSLYRRLPEWYATDGARDAQRGYCETPLGRRRYVESMPGEDFQGIVRKMVNTPVQATASDLTLAAMVLADEELERRGSYGVYLAHDESTWGQEAYMIGFVHDSLMLDGRNDVVREISAIVQTSMENPMLERLGIELPVPLKSDVEVGENWLDAKKLPEPVAA